jgi:hypothetical protein
MHSYSHFLLITFFISIYQQNKTYKFKKKKCLFYQNKAIYPKLTTPVFKLMGLSNCLPKA